MPDPSQMTCSHCRRPFDAATTATRPFCSRRCQTIDLGRWLSEEIEIPHEGGSEADQEPPDQVREIRFDDD